MYRDNRLVVWKGCGTKKQVEQWLKRFQIRVDVLAGGNYLQFIAKIWEPRDMDSEILTMEMVVKNKDSIDKGKQKSKVKVLEGEWSLFLDTKMKWQQSGLLFQVQSTNRPSTFRSITSKVLKRISQFTSKAKSLQGIRIDKIYPGHADALCKAGLGKQQFPMVEEVWSKEELAESVVKKKKQHNKQNIYLVIRFSKFSRELELPKLLKRLHHQYNLSWIWINITYKCFMNLRKKFSGDLMGKINDGVETLGFKTQPCNCNTQKEM
eukprot:10905224-Ditylum_brightwellii.AAC.1